MVLAMKYQVGGTIKRRMMPPTIPMVRIRLLLDSGASSRRTGQERNPVKEAGR
jgi:hypothetical protein